MRWSTSLGASARREAVLVSALAAGAAIAALAGPLGVAWLTIAGLIVAAAGALARVGIAVRRAGLESERQRVELGRLVRVGVAPIGEVEPTLIGIDRAEQTILPGGGVPDYVRRVADAQLRAAVVSALDGSGPWMIVVEGPSKVGKSRSLFEALRESARTSPLHLVAPVTADALRSLLTVTHPVTTPAKTASRPFTPPSTGPGAAAPIRSPTTRCGGCGRATCRRAPPRRTIASPSRSHGR